MDSIAQIVKKGYNIKAMYDEDDRSITAAINSPKANHE